MNKLKYVSSERYFEGIIVEISDCAISIDLKGRMGQLKLPRRMVISENALELGQEVGMLMSYPEVLSGEIDTEYAKNAQRQLKLEK